MKYKGLEILSSGMVWNEEVSRVGGFRVEPLLISHPDSDLIPDSRAFEPIARINEIKLLLLEDSRSDALLFQKLLKKASNQEPYAVVVVEKLADAIALLKRSDFDIIVSDLSLPDSSGLQTVEALRKQAPSKTLVVLTGLMDEEIGMSAVRCGAQDYIVKGSFNANELSLALKFAIERQRALIEVKSDQSISAYSANYDPLTFLPNRILFSDRLERALIHAKRDSRIFAIFSLDLEGFEGINEAFGGQTGDTLLKILADRFRKIIRGSDTVARVGSDQFAFIFYDLKKVEDAAVVAKKLMKLFKAPLMIESNRFHVSTSIGISLFPSNITFARELLEASDEAMYEAKELGPNQFRFSSAKLNVYEKSTLEQEKAIGKAVENQEIQVHYQPQANLSNDSIVGMQAILRWNHPQSGILPAHDFLPVAESTGLAVQMNEFLLHSACQQLKIWRRHGGRRLRLFLGLSAAQLQRTETISTIASAIKRYDLDADCLTFEVAESDILINRDRNIAFLNQLHAIGVKLALDNFGVGMSSVGNVRAIPFSTVKIDRSLTADLMDNDSGYSVVKALIDVVHGFGLESVAEGIEDQAQVAILKKMGCQIGQGPVFGQPELAEAFFK